MLLNDDLGYIYFRGSDSVTYRLGTAIYSKAAADGDSVIGKVPADLMFATTPIASGGLTERMRIKENGNVGIGTPTPASRLHMKTTGTGWSPLTIEAESASGANAIAFRRSRSSGLPAQDTDDCGVLRFEYMRPRDWGVSAWIDSRIVDVDVPGKPEGKGELTFVVMMEDGPKERMRIHADGSVTMGEAPSPNEPAANLLVRSLTHAFIEARAASGYSPQFRLYEGPTYRWAMHCQAGSDWLRWSDPVGPQMYLTTAGDLYINGTYNTWSPVPPKENMTPDDYLDWALQDARKPHKPYAEMPDSVEEVARYGKDVSKIAIGTARYVESLRDQIKTLEARLACLEGA